MKNSSRDRFDGRLKTASEAKQHRLERFKVAVDDPEKLAKRAERHAVAAARETQRKASVSNLLREKEDLERQQALAAETEIMREATQEAERKAERDRRYAARRNRKR